MRHLRLGVIGAVWLGALFVASYAGCEKRVEPTFEADAHIWDHVPLRVHLDAELADSYDDSLREAVIAWKRAAGCPLFEITTDAATADVKIINGNPTDDRGDCKAKCSTTEHAACACLRVGAMVTAEVYYLAPNTIDVAYVTFAHELGHVLGFADDPGVRTSMMRPDVIKGVSESSTFLRISDSDRKAARKRYCSK